VKDVLTDDFKQQVKAIRKIRAPFIVDELIEVSIM